MMKLLIGTAVGAALGAAIYELGLVRLLVVPWLSRLWRQCR
jgi:hypothetical protein